MARKLGVGIIGCGNISTTYFSLVAAVQGHRGQGLRRHQSGGGESQGQGIRRPRGKREQSAQGQGCRHRRQPDHPGGPLRDFARGARRRQARLFGKALRAVGQGRARPEEARGEEEAARRLGARHLPRRRAPARARPDRQGQARQDHRRHLLRDEPRHGALASQSRTSSSSRAPVRCSTSGLTTSPT